MMKQPLIKNWSLLSKKIAVLSIIIFQFCYCLYSQNLVPNYSFEDTTSCPTGVDGEIYLAAPWYSPTTGTPDLFNSCDSFPNGVPSNWAGTESAWTGNGYCGIYTFSSTQIDVREYIQVPLDSILIAGKWYYVEFYVSLGETSTFAANDIGAYFSSSPVSSSDYYVLPYVPQIANGNNPLTSFNGWVKVSGGFVATGGEKYLTIGNFKNNANTDTVTVNANNQWNFSYYYIDDVLVMEDTSNSINELSEEIYFSVFPNPVKDEIIFTNDFSSGKIIIRNTVGQKVYFGQFEKELNISFLSEGIYIIEVALPGKTYRAKFVKE